MRLLPTLLCLTVLIEPALARDSRHHARHKAERHHASMHHHRHVRHAHRSYTHHRRHVQRVASYESTWGNRGDAGSQTTRFERAPGYAANTGVHAMISRHAQAQGVPEALVHRVVIRESRYNPRAVGRGGAMGLMQIKYSTARAMGYTGSPSGLLDPETNLTYAVRYLAGAYRAAGGSHDRAVSNYARGYYFAAKRQGFSPYRGVRTSSWNSGWSGSYAAADYQYPSPTWPGEPRRWRGRR